MKYVVARVSKSFGKELSENEEYQNWDNYYTKLVELAIGVKFYE